MVDQEVTDPVARGPRERAERQRKIAIVGAGPAGLSCAYFLARLGYRPDVFEAEPPARRDAGPGHSRLPPAAGNRRPRSPHDRADGRRHPHRQVLGEDFTLKSLRGGGLRGRVPGRRARRSGVGLGIPGEDAEGITDALSFLRTYNLRGSVPVGKNVVVIGGGNSAIDAARTAVRSAPRTVTVVYRRSREAMPAYEEEIEEAEHEGVDCGC